MSILLSIIIPVYNVEQYIAQCLKSCVEQNVLHEDYEVIVVDDGTPDNSMAIVDEFCKNYPNIRIIHQENQGLSGARNTGLKEAKGEYVWFVDSDDWLMEGALERVFKEICSPESPSLISSPLLWIYEDDESKNRLDMNYAQDFIVEANDYLRRGISKGAIPRYVVRRSLMIDNNIQFYPGILHEDDLFHAQIVYVAKRIKVLSEPLYYYRQRLNGSIMHSLTIRSSYDIITVSEQMMKFCDEVVHPDDRPWFRIMALKEINYGMVINWNLRHTPEYTKFMADTKRFRREQCTKCMAHSSVKVKVKCMMMKYMPMLYCWMLKNDCIQSMRRKWKTIR